MYRDYSKNRIDAQTVPLLTVLAQAVVGVSAPTRCSEEPASTPPSGAPSCIRPWVRQQTSTACSTTSMSWPRFSRCCCVWRLSARAFAVGTDWAALASTFATSSTSASAARASDRWCPIKRFDGARAEVRQRTDAGSSCGQIAKETTSPPKHWEMAISSPTNQPVCHPRTRSVDAGMAAS